MKLVEKRFVEDAVSAKELVVVAFVPVALTKVKLLASKLSENKSVNRPIVEKKFVVVALVIVAYVPSPFVNCKLLLVNCDENRFVVVAEVPVARVKRRSVIVISAVVRLSMVASSA